MATDIFHRPAPEKATAADVIPLRDYGTHPVIEDYLDADLRTVVLRGIPRRTPGHANLPSDVISTLVRDTRVVQVATLAALAASIIGEEEADD